MYGPVIVDTRGTASCRNPYNSLEETAANWFDEFRPQDPPFLIALIKLASN